MTLSEASVFARVLFEVDVSFVDRRLVRDCFVAFDERDVRAGFPSTSAETSNVQRTRRSVLRSGIRMERFGTMIRPGSTETRQFVYRRVFGPDGTIEPSTLTRRWVGLSNPCSRLLTFAPHPRVD